MHNITKKKFVDFLSLQAVFILFSFVGIFSKKASQYEFISPEYIMLVVVELAILFIYAILWQQVIKRFDLSTAYSSKGVIIIWTFLWSMIVFNETVTVNNIIGAIIIICGIIRVNNDK